MKRLSEEITQFFQSQGFVIVSTIDRNGTPHNSCKGIAKISNSGRVYVIDLYKAITYKNLRRNPRISIAAVDEHRFRGYCLKGKAYIVPVEALHSKVKKIWEEKIASRLTNRVIKNIREEKGHYAHPEALLPKPEYMIVADIDEVINLTPADLR